MAEPPVNRSVHPTRWNSVIVAAVLGAGAGWAGFAVLESFGGPGMVPQLPMTVAGAIALLAVFIGIQAWLTHQAVQVRRERIESGRALMMLVLGKAGLLTGAALTGAYTAVALYFAERVEAALPRQRVVTSVVAILVSLLLAIAGAFLQRACRIPRSEDPRATPKDVCRSPDSPV